MHPLSGYVTDCPVSAMEVPVSLPPSSLRRAAITDQLTAEATRDQLSHLPIAPSAAFVHPSSAAIAQEDGCQRLFDVLARKTN